MTHTLLICTASSGGRCWSSKASSFGFDWSFHSQTWIILRVGFNGATNQHVIEISEHSSKSLHWLRRLISHAICVKFPFRLTFRTKKVSWLHLLRWNLSVQAKIGHLDQAPFQMVVVGAAWPHDALKLCDSVQGAHLPESFVHEKCQLLSKTSASNAGQSVLYPWFIHRLDHNNGTVTQWHNSIIWNKMTINLNENYIAKLTHTHRVGPGHFESCDRKKGIPQCNGSLNHVLGRSLSALDFQVLIEVALEHLDTDSLLSTFVLQELLHGTDLKDALNLALPEAKNKWRLSSKVAQTQSIISYFFRYNLTQWQSCDRCIVQGLIRLANLLSDLRSLPETALGIVSHCEPSEGCREPTCFPLLLNQFHSVRQIQIWTWSVSRIDNLNLQSIFQQTLIENWVSSMYSPLLTSRHVESMKATCSSSGLMRLSCDLKRVWSLVGSEWLQTAMVISIEAGFLHRPLIKLLIAELMRGTLHGDQNGFAHAAFPPAVYLCPRFWTLINLKSVACKHPPFPAWRGLSFWMLWKSSCLSKIDWPETQIPNYWNLAGECHLCGTHSNDDDDHDGGDNKADGEKKAVVLNNHDDSQCSLKERKDLHSNF